MNRGTWLLVLAVLAAALAGCQTYEAYPSESETTHPYQYHEGVDHEHEQYHY